MAVLTMVLAIVAALTVVVIGGIQIALAEIDSAEVTAIETTGYPLLRETRAAAAAQLNNSGVVDAEAGIYRVPIERAMADVVAYGSDSRTTEVTLTR